MKMPSKAAHAAGGKHKAEKPQGKTGPSGINKPVSKALVPQVDMKTKYGKPSQTQKM